MEQSTKPASVEVAQKKPSKFKRSLMYVLVLGVLGGSGYVAYKQSVLDQYLPNALKANPEVSVPVSTDAPNNEPQATQSIPPVVNSSESVPDAETTTPSTSAPPMAAPMPAESTNLGGPAGTLNALAPASSAPITLSINGAQGNALLTAVDTQWQWQAAQQDFKQNWDGAALLQKIQSLKLQLQNARDANFAPVLAALTQVETQVQTWQAATPSSNYLTALQQASLAVDGIQLRLKPTEPAATAEPASGFWGGLMDSLKNVIVVEKVDGTSKKVLDESTAALIKQSINARLQLAQLAAQNAQWPQAQAHAKAANELLTQWADSGSQSAFNGLKPLIEQTKWANVPDLNVVTLSLQQTRSAIGARAASSAQEAPSAPAVNPAPAQTTPKSPNANGVKGGV